MNTPESNLARRLVEKYSLRPPIDINVLTRSYARVEVMNLPLDLDSHVDGVTFDLKASGKQPTIVLNKNRPLARRRFTLAHELGHVLIPWHIGLIVDEIDLISDGKHTPYWVLESEANRFASELLMPNDWMLEVIKTRESPPEVLEDVVTNAVVSRNAAVIRLIDCMTAGHVYALLDSDGVVVSSGRSPGTLANKPEPGTLVDRQTIFPVSDRLWESSQADGLYVWWRLPCEAELPRAEDQRPWRDILDEIVDDLSIPRTRVAKFKQSVNGVIANANSQAHMRTAEAIYSAAMQRFHSRAIQNDKFREFVKHRKFKSYVIRRIHDFLKTT